ncbi:MAG: hypothetical protein R2769_10655 [Saprospiraceae bacterium]
MPVNQGYYLKFDLEMRRYIDHCSDHNMGLRYIGSHGQRYYRILLQGGIFLYPNTRKYPQGKLRLLYEYNPLSFVVENAGGKALPVNWTGCLILPMQHLHQRATIAIGSPAMVDEFREFVERLQRNSNFQLIALFIKIKIRSGPVSGRIFIFKTFLFTKGLQKFSALFPFGIFFVEK